MRILRLRRGFQADHSSSSYFFYAVDRPVSAEGQRIAHRYSSRAEVSDRTARYQKWGDSELAWGAYKSLLGAHYDLMASESYDWWTLRITVPKTAATQALLAPFAGARGVDDQGVDVEDYGARLAAVVYCRMDYSGPVFSEREDPLEAIIERLKTVRKELLAGNGAFLRSVADLYAIEEDEAGDDAPEPATDRSATKEDLLEECVRRGIVARSSWTKAQIEAALKSAPRPHRPAAEQRPAKRSRAARELVDSMDASG